MKDKSVIIFFGATDIESADTVNATPIPRGLYAVMYHTYDGHPIIVTTVNDVTKTFRVTNNYIYIDQLDRVSSILNDAQETLRMRR